MLNSKKNSSLFALTILASLLLLAALNCGVVTVSAQSQATVIIADTQGGSTDPAAGTYNYDAGTTVTITATPINPTTTANGFSFTEWIIQTDQGQNIDTDNPLSFPVSAGTTYTISAVFDPVLVPPGGSVVQPSQITTAAVVVILASAGGTTDPGPGTYFMASATNFNLQAKAATGWQFSHWVIEGPNLSHGGYPFTATPTENPYNINHGYGNTFSYQAVFEPIGAPTPTPGGGGGGGGGSTAVGASMIDIAIIIVLVVVIVIVLIAFAVYSSRKK